MKLKESGNLVWSSTAQQDYYFGMSDDELRKEVRSIKSDEEFEDDFGYSIDEADEDDLLSVLMPDDVDLDYENFEQNIVPMVEKQCKDYNETLVLFGSAANWQGSREACAIISADEFEDYIYPNYAANTKIYSDNGALFYTQSSHDTPMGGTAMYLYSFKSDDDYEKASHLCDTEDWEGDFVDDAEYKEVGEAIKQGFLTPVRNTFNESLEEGWYQFEYKSGANPYIAKTEKERDKILKKYGKKVTKIKDGFYEIDDKEEKMDSFNFDESFEKNLKEALSRYTFTDGMELTASSEEEVIQKYEDIEKNRNKGKTRPFETLNSIAEDLYEKEDDFSFHYFSDDELALLWGYCCVADVSYDDEVYEAISDFPNKREIFAKAKEYAQKNVDFKLGEAYSQSDLMNAVQDAYGYSKKEAKKYIANADEKTKAELVKGYKDNAKRSFLTDSLNEGKGNIELLHSVAEPFVDALDVLEDRGEEVEITWNFGFDRDGNVTAGIDLRPTPRITKAKKTDELFKVVLPQFEKLMKQYGFVLDDNIKHENPSKNIFGGYHYQIKKIDLDECNIAEAFDLDEARYSDAYDKETRQNGWWYFTTHGVGPGTLPKDVHIIETREGQNEKGTWGDFIKLDGILNTDELKYFDLKELAPTDEEEEDGWDRWETESSRDDWDSDEDFSGFFSDYEFNENLNEAKEDYSVSDLQRAVEYSLKKYGFDYEHGYSLDFIPKESAGFPYLEVEFSDGLDWRDYKIISKRFSSGSDHWFKDLPIYVCPGKEHIDGGLLSVIFSPKYKEFDDDFNEAFTNPKGSLSDYVEYLGKRSSSFGFSDDETAKKELKKRFPNITKSDLDKVIKRWHTGKLEEATSNKKFTIKYGKGRPGGDSEVVEFPSAKEAEKYAADHAKGWGFEVTPFDESLNEDKTPYGDTTIEDYVEANFWGDREDKGLFIQYMKKKAVGGDYFNGLNMSNKDWEKEGQKFGLSMKRFPVTEDANKLVYEDAGFKDGIIDFLRGLRLGDEYDSEQVGDWEVSAWTTRPRHNFSSGFYIVQLDNDKLNKHYHIGDCQSQGELEDKIEGLIKRKLSSDLKGFDENLNEDTVKTSDGKWTNKGKEGTHGKFKTKKEADQQRKAMFARGFKG